MKVRLQVITQEHRTWPAKDGQPAGESFNLICQDMSLPGEARMTENVALRLKDEEVKKYWNTSIDKTFDVAVRRIVTNKSGKASVVGDIIEEPAKK
jgi:hypothetical protein